MGDCMSLRSRMLYLAIWVMLGAVTVVAGNTAPVASSHLSLSISEPNLVEFGRTVLQCEATVIGAQVMAISKDNQPIIWAGDLLPNFQDPRGPGSSRFILAEVPGASGRVITLLTIDPVCTQDRGNYSCAVYEPAGASGFSVVRSVSSRISSVIPFDSSDMCSPSGPIAVLAGDELSLVCTWRSASPTLQWTDDAGSVIDSVLSFPTDHMQNVVSNEFSVTVTDELQGATYQCTVTMTGCDTEARKCTVGPITVISEPRVIVTSTPNPIVFGRMAEFLCTVLPNATSSPPTVSWHTVPPLEQNRAFFSSSGPSRMRLQSVQPEDQNIVVYCTVTFENGTQVIGQSELVILTNSSGPNTAVDSTADDLATSPEGTTQVTPSSSSPDLPFLLFGSYPATIAIISGASILVALLLALIVFCWCRGCKKRRRKPGTESRRPLRMSPSTFGGTTPGHEVPGSGTDGMYMYATIFDPDEKWGATPSTTPSAAPTLEAMDQRGYQQPMSGPTTPPVYSQVGPPSITEPGYMETNIDLPNPKKTFEISCPDGMVGNVLYQSSGEYVDPETTNQQQVDKEMAVIRAEKNLSPVKQAPSGPITMGYLAIGQVPEEARREGSRAKNTEPVTYMEICD